MSRYLITGSRKYSGPMVDLVVCGLALWAKISGNKYTIIHGDAPGADKLAGESAEDYPNNLDIESFPAHWALHGKSAGPKRNQQMLDEADPKVVIAFHDDFSNSLGTRDMCRRAVNKGLPVYLVSRLTKKDVNG